MATKKEAMTVTKKNGMTNLQHIKMKYLGKLSLGWCLGMAMAFVAVPASSINPQEPDKEYRLDSLETLVDSMMPRLDTYDGFTAYKAYFETIDKVVTPREWADRMKADALSQMFDNFSTDSQDDLYSLYMQQSEGAADSLRQKVTAHHEAMIRKYGHLFPGKPAPNLTFIDEAGKQLSLASFRGKTLLVDIWGTWCGPCKAEVPYIADLQKQYASRKDVCIISIACDKKAEKWKAYIAKHPATWPQYLVTDAGNKMLDDEYFCVGIPRFLIIDREGRFITSDAPRPSDASFNEYFKKIVNE